MTKFVPWLFGACVVLNTFSAVIAGMSNKLVPCVLYSVAAVLFDFATSMLLGLRNRINR